MPKLLVNQFVETTEGALNKWKKHIPKIMSTASDTHFTVLKKHPGHGSKNFVNHHVGWLHQKKIWSMIISSRNRCQYDTSSHLCRWHHYYKQWQQVFIDRNSFSIPHFTWRISLSLNQHKYTNNLITTLASTIPISWRLLEVKLKVKYRKDDVISQIQWFIGS